MRKVKKIIGTNKMRNFARKRTADKVTDGVYHVTGGRDEHMVYVAEPLEESDCLTLTGEYAGEVHRPGELCCHKICVYFLDHVDEGMAMQGGKR